MSPTNTTDVEVPAAANDSNDSNDRNDRNESNAGNNVNGDDCDLGYEEEDRSDLSRVQALVRLVVGPIGHYDMLLTVQGRRRYCDLVTEEPLGPVLRWVPLVVLMAVASVHTAVALWTAFGIDLVQCLLDRYHSSYKPKYPAYYWLSVGQTVTYLAMAVVDVVLADGIDPDLISPVVFSALLFVTVLSMTVGRPFTKQMAQHRVPPAVRRSERFHKISMILTAVWVVVFGIASAASWISYALIGGGGSGSSSSDARVLQTVVGTVVPLVTIFGGMFLMQPIADYLKEATLGNSNEGQNSKEEEEEEEEEETKKTSKNADEDIETGL